MNSSMLCTVISLLLQFAANYARDMLIPNINKKVIELKDMIAGRPTRSTGENEEDNGEAAAPSNETKASGSHLDRKKSFRKTVSTSDDYVKKNQGVTDPELLNKLDSLPRPITREVRESHKNSIYKFL